MALLTEGAGDLKSDDFQNAMRDKAISIGFDADRDYVTVDLTTLTDNRARDFELLKLALTAQRFDDEPLEIGRASCRERGHQYGQISVVAVYLQKKTIH